MSVENRLEVEGASIFYRIAGSGPPLLLLAGGDADADGCAGLQAALCDHFRVIAYDRRGLSRSLPPPGSPRPNLQTHARDALALIEHVADEPAFVFGTSLGGLFGLELMAWRPDMVRRIMVHEAPTAELMDGESEARMRAAQGLMQATFEREGVEGAMRISAQMAAMDPEDREADVEPAEMTARREANLTFLYTYDAPQVRRYRAPLEALKSVADRIVPAAGRSTTKTLLHKCAAALAAELGRPLALMPGGHTGWLLRPRAFAEDLVRLMEDAEMRGETEQPRPHDGPDRRAAPLS